MKRKKMDVALVLGGMMFGMVTGVLGMGKLIGSRFANAPVVSNKYLDLFLLMNQWVKIKQKNKNISTYFENAGYKRIAIYGMSDVGMTLLDELKGTGVEVAYGIDKRADEIFADVDIVTMEMDFDVIDVIVVTAITFFEEIKEELSAKVDCPIISLRDIIYEI